MNSSLSLRGRRCHQLALQVHCAHWRTIFSFLFFLSTHSLAHWFSIFSHWTLSSSFSHVRPTGPRPCLPRVCQGPLSRPSNGLPATPLPRSERSECPPDIHRADLANTSVGASNDRHLTLKIDAQVLDAGEGHQLCRRFGGYEGLPNDRAAQEHGAEKGSGAYLQRGVLGEQLSDKRCHGGPGALAPATPKYVNFRLSRLFPFCTSFVLLSSSFACAGLVRLLLF